VVGQLPILTLSAPIHCRTAFPVPNYELVRLALKLPKVQRKRRTFPEHWDKSIPKVIWRGAPTGKNRMEQNDRVQLCRYVHQDPALTKYVDAKLVLSKPMQRTALKDTQYQPLIAPSPSTFDQYRAVLDIDGNSWSSRFASLLCSQQVVLKVDPLNVDAFFPTVVPHVHYLPVHANLSNLAEQAAKAVTLAWPTKRRKFGRPMPMFWCRSSKLQRTRRRTFRTCCEALRLKGTPCGTERIFDFGLTNC